MTYTVFKSDNRKIRSSHLNRIVSHVCLKYMVNSPWKLIWRQFVSNFQIHWCEFIYIFSFPAKIKSSDSVGLIEVKFVFKRSINRIKWQKEHDQIKKFYEANPWTKIVDNLDECDATKMCARFTRINWIKSRQIIFISFTFSSWLISTLSPVWPSFLFSA